MHHPQPSSAPAEPASQQARGPAGPALPTLPVLLELLQQRSTFSGPLPFSPSSPNLAPTSSSLHPPPPGPACRVSDLAFGETNSTTSSWDAPPLEAGSQSFLCRLPVTGLAVTRSGRGITAKRIIMLTTSGEGRCGQGGAGQGRGQGSSTGGH